MGKQTSHLPEGTLLSGRYRIVKFIGSGGFGCTYLADHLLFDTKVAIKEFFVSSLCHRDNTGVVSIGTESQTMIVEKLANKFLR
ncbi:MAG: serine/threonine protein kinase, partial [Muribaculaceae bacterium]|nr:serine/threonine protein kinase [Muribaculaceae bacterium]